MLEIAARRDRGISRTLCPPAIQPSADPCESYHELIGGEQESERTHVNHEQLDPPGSLPRRKPYLQPNNERQMNEVNPIRRIRQITNPRGWPVEYADKQSSPAQHGQ